jgi:hypothetical protein
MTSLDVGVKGGITNMIKVVIDRKKWYRGQGDLTSCLLLSTGKMCCIGFLAKKLGAKPGEIRNTKILEDTTKPSLLSFASENDSVLTIAYEVNDDEQIDDKEREASLKEIGKEMGVQFTFKN